MKEMNANNRCFPAVAALAIAAFSALSAAGTEYVWDGSSVQYGDEVAVTFDGDGKVTKLVATVPDGEEAVFTGGGAVFAAGAEIELAAPGSVVFSNAVTPEGRLVCTSTRAGELALSGDSDFKPGSGRLIPGSRNYRLENVSFKAGKIFYNASSFVDADAYYEKTSNGRRTLQLQDWNGAWTRCIKIALVETEEGIVVSNLYAKCTSSSGENILGEDFDGELSADV